MYPDINCDMGEGIGNDELLMPFITSASIACGYHAGHEDSMKRTAELCMKYSVKIGAHPSFADRENFGRTEMNISPEAAEELVANQIHALNKIVTELGATLHHVKPHGALYNMAAKNRQLAVAIIKAVKKINPQLVLYGLSNSCLVNEAAAAGLVAWNEVFADRTYADDGSLTPRSKTNALIESDEQCVQQVLQMITDGLVTSTGGKRIVVKADTICIHGDGIHALEFAKAIDFALKNR